MKKHILVILYISLLAISYVRSGCDDVDDDADDDDDDDDNDNQHQHNAGQCEHGDFSKHTQEMAKLLNLVGWVRNTEFGSVQGQVQGAKKDLDQMEHWLRYIGSPNSKIERMEKQKFKILQRADYTSFEIRE